MFRWFLLPLLAVASAYGQVYEGKTLVQPSLIADVSAIVPGKPFEVGLVLEMAPSWHTYWEYAGDAGVPTKITWTLPNGFSAGPIQWPLPVREQEPGDIEVYAYGDKVVLLTTLTPPAQIKETSVTLQAKVSWLVCAEICIPGSANLDLTLPVAQENAPANAGTFARFRSQLPSSDPSPYQLAWQQGKDAQGKDIVTLTVSGLQGAKAVDLFPLPAKSQIVEHPQDGAITDGSATIAIPAQGELRGVLVVETGNGRQGWFVSSGSLAAPSTSVTPVPFPSAPSAAEPSSSGAAGQPATFWSILFAGLHGALLSGFIGGLILNLMPCVLPVISLKIFGFIKQAGSHPERILRHGLAFVAGIFAWFLGLGVLIAAFKAAGTNSTWGSQFQNPWFNLTIGCIVLVFALNLFGVFEIILPGRASNAIAKASSGSGYAGSFFQGIFATLLATPCTAPFLGTALGFALSSSPGVILAMFASIAAGMSAPYLLLAANPAWMKALPRAGEWMERLKQFMGFPLIATLLWLLFIIVSQKGADAIFWAGGFLLCVALACWIYGAFLGPCASARARIIAVLSLVAILGWGSWYFLGNFATAGREGGGAAASDEIAWVPFSPKALDDLLEEKKPVFVDFTADWCISCKFNERTAINTPEVRAAFRKNGIVAMKADWTSANPEITQALQKFGRVGVPFYVLYPAGKADAPITLPEVLTKQIVLDALAKAR